MKKIPRLFLSTLIFSLIFAPLFLEKAQAASYGGPSWTAPELLEYKSALEAEGATLCGDDDDCLNSYYELKFTEDENKYRALSRLKSYQLLPTELNFETGTIKILLFDKNMKADIYLRAPKDGIVVKELLIWIISESVPEADGYYSTATILNGEVPGTQPLFGFTKSNLIELAKDEEAEYPMLANSKNMTDARYNRIKFSFSSNFFNSSSNYSFSGCSYVHNFPKGKCVLTVSSRDFSYKFVETSIEESPTTENPNLPTNPTKDENDDENIPEQPDISEQECTLSATEIIPRAPDTGTATLSTCQKVIEFPWWLAGLIAVADIVLLWLFWPKKSKKS